MRFSFLGLFVFIVLYLFWVLMGFSFVMYGIVLRDEIMGVVIGYVWYFFLDVYLFLYNGFCFFDLFFWWRRMFECRFVIEMVEDINNDVLVVGLREVGVFEV